MNTLMADERSAVIVTLSENLKPGVLLFEAAVNPKHTFDEINFTDNLEAGSLTIPGSWWPPQPPWYSPLPEVVAVILLGGISVKVIKRLTRPPQQVNTPIPTIPTLAARPTLHPGQQTLDLSEPGDGGVGLGFRLNMSAMAVQIDEHVSPAQGGRGL